MKPSLDMDKKEPLPQTVFEDNINKRPKMIKRAVIGLSAVVVIALVISLSVYFGMKMTRDTYMEAWQTYKSQDGRVVEEKVTVTDESVDIKVPNEMRVVYDYTHGLMVQRFVSHKTGLYGPCYASYINESIAANPKEVMDTIDESETDLPEESDVVKGNVKFTENKVPRYMISKEVEEMCSDTEIYWMESTDESVEKRSVTCAYVDIYYVCYYYTWGARCHVYYLCYDSFGRYLGYYYKIYLYYI